MAGWYYHDGKWSDQNPKLLGPADHAFWLSSIIFDGARSFGGLAPDLDRHCRRSLVSAAKLGLAPKQTAEEVEALCREGIRRFPREAELYIRPMFFATDGWIGPNPDSTDFVLAVYESPMPPPGSMKITLSPFRRPARDMATTDAKASGLYPNSGRALNEAVSRGFDNAVMLDPAGNVAELATSNIWFAKDGVAVTPAANGTFLNGITRQRVAILLREAGMTVEERSVTYAELLQADEIFTTGNFGKVQPITRIEDRDLQPGPVYAKARALYWQFAETANVF